jgi:AcrR family transcriptional regulator
LAQRVAVPTWSGEAGKEELAMTKESKSAAAPASRDTRERIVDALMALAAERRFEEIAIRDICAAAKVSLADFRDAFPSKGAVLGGFARRIDRATLSQDDEEIAREAPRERLFDVLMRRLDAMTPYREALREIAAWLRRDPVAALAINRSAVNSMRFMLEAAGIDSEGAAGAITLQGLALAWARVVAVWLDDPEPGLDKTMAELDRQLTRGERAVAGLERLERLAAPFKAIALAALEQRGRARDAFRRRAREAEAPRQDETPRQDDAP